MTTTDVAGAALPDPIAQAVPPEVLRPADAAHRQDPRGRETGQALALALPRTTAEVAALVRAAHDTGTPIVPYSGGTGLVLGQIKSRGRAPLLLSLERMTAVRGLWPDEGVMIVEAGAILQDVQMAASEAGLLFPLAMASQGSCRIGGNLATNAGGVQVLRYGNARDLCLGLEAVLPDGAIWNGLKRLRKDNTGYDLRNLLIGSEGTLGVITAACLRVMPRPTRQAAACMTLRDPAAALRVLRLARARVGDGVTAFELIANQSLTFLATTRPDIRQPFATPPEWMALIDLGLFGETDPQDALTAIYSAAEAEGLSDDAVMATSEAQRAEFWALREAIPDANRRIGAVSSHDISLPLGALPAFIPAANAAISALGPFRVNCFGHVGDGNLHYNVFPPEGGNKADWGAMRAEITHTVHSIVDSMGGSVSAEHGVGRLKVEDLERYGDQAKMAAMRAIKAALDPGGIMNPGAVLRG